MYQYKFAHRHMRESLQMGVAVQYESTLGIKLAKWYQMSASIHNAPRPVLLKKCRYFLCKWDSNVAIKGPDTARRSTIMFDVDDLKLGVMFVTF